MYKKINITRNSSFKKASIFIAVAAFASCAVFLGTERFNYNGEEAASSVYAFNSFRYGSWGRYNNGNKRSRLDSFYRIGRNGRYRPLSNTYYGRSVSELTNNQRVNFDAVLKEAKLIIGQMRNRLTNLAGMPDRIADLGVAGLGTIPNKVANYIFDRTEVFKKLDLPQDNPYVVDELFGSMKDCLQRLNDCQNYLLEVIQSMGTLLELDRIKDKEKLEELKNSGLDKSIKCPDDLINLAGIKKIISSGNKSIETAKKIIEKAKAAFFDATTFDETKEYDPWATNWANRNTDGSCYKLVATLQTLLYINQQINSVNEHIIASEIVGSLQQAFKAVFVMDSFSILATADLGKGWFFNEFINNDRIDLLTMPLVLATLEQKSGSQTEVFKGVEFAGAATIKSISEKFVEKLVDASRSGRQPKDLISVLNELTNKAVNKTQTQTICYDLKEILGSVVDEQTAKELFKQLDDVLLSMFSQGNSKFMSERLREQKQNFEAQGLSPQNKEFPWKDFMEAEEQQGLEYINRLLQSGGPMYRFVDNGGQLNPAVVAIGSEGDTANLRAAIATMKGAATVLSVPKWIRNSALVKLIIDKYKYNYNSTAILEDDANSWFDITRFNAAVSEVADKIQAIYSESKKAIDKVSQVKSKEKSTSKNKEKSRESSSSRSITNLLSLDAGNRNSDSIVVKAQGKTIEVSNLPSNVTKLSPVLCPKVSTNSKEGDKNIDLPLVDVVNGRATIDLTTQLNAAGNYELHFRNAELDPATKNVVKYVFLQKSKFAYAADKTKPQSMSKITVDQADNSYLDFSTAEAIINEDKSITYRVKAKSGASSNPATMTGVCFKSGASPSMEHDKFALQLASDKKTYTFTTNKGLEGNVEFHIYSGEVEAANYEGKIEAKTAETTEIESKEGTSIYSLIDKNASTASSRVDGFVEKVVKFVIPDDYLDDILDSDLDSIDYDILDSSGKAVYSGTIGKLRKDSRNRRGDNVYKVNIMVPKGGKEYTIRISSGFNADDMVLESYDRISSKTEINKEIGFRGVTNSWNSYWD